tara:strand:- start:6368 stop:7414 length:1047 start_codon:yes stop_codon:yes gene_type:complete
MKLFKLIIFILIVFLKTETLFSENNLFNVNNIQIKKKDKITNKVLADKAIKKGFNQLLEKILLKKDIDIFSNLSFSSIKQLVIYYQIGKIPDKENTEQLVNFNITFDKEKIHDLFFKRGVLYSKISDKDLYVLPILYKSNEVFIFNNNFFYEKWNEIYDTDLIEFILPLENIESIKIINEQKSNLINLKVDKLFKEYSIKNLALILIEDSDRSKEKVYVKTRIQGKNIFKSLEFKRQNLNSDKFYEKIITETKKELIDLVKSKNLIDVRTPSFLNIKLSVNKKSNLVMLNTRIKNIDSIENIYVQDFNKEFMSLRIKYLGKLEKLINDLKKENINLKLINEKWVIKTL